MGREIFPENLYAIWPTSDYCFFGGTNSFTSHLLSYKQHGFRLRDLFHFGDLISPRYGLRAVSVQTWSLLFFLLGEALLSDSCIHSVRDNYTKEMLYSIGIKNASNTLFCPTTWSLY